MMRIAYMMQVHKNFDQIVLLIDIIKGEDKHYCFIHVDSKNDILYYQLKEKYIQKMNIIIMDDRINVKWGSISQVCATLRLMRAVKNTNIAFDRIHLMSGEDYPIKPLEYIESFLCQNRDYEFLEYEDIGSRRWAIKRYIFFTEIIKNRKLLLFWHRVSRKLQKIFLHERNNLKEFKLYKGSSWFNISNKALIFILDYIDKNPKYLSDFRHTSYADEHFFQILLLNSPFMGKIVNNNLYFMKWIYPKPNPEYLTVNDILEAQKIKDLLFARKINEKIAKELVEFTGEA